MRGVLYAPVGMRGVLYAPVGMVGIPRTTPVGMVGIPRTTPVGMRGVPPAMYSRGYERCTSCYVLPVPWWVYHTRVYGHVYHPGYTILSPCPVCTMKGVVQRSVKTAWAHL